MSASSSYGGNPVACAAALATIEVIEEEGLLENARRIEKVVMKRLGEMKERYEIVGDVRGKGALFGIELVKDEETKEPFEEAGRFVYRRAFEKGLAWIPAGHILRLSPPLIMPEEIALKGLDILEEAIDEAQREVRR
ncbi:TPA: aminotransferase class III-fold pyridoxal phosphate-dependent enzyme [Candidatus Poribacteria bacterium]|nr:aminotransferase class III-fold pyridoxal phosphate-dependent enzyme [Candidatus Poribacteria bacterium]HEX30941.1 aminotransferase class III-fold pyridoxal phosphate-dependent enzyme [Candidatus Poribacteria bacterium]